MILGAMAALSIGALAAGCEEEVPGEYDDEPAFIVEEAAFDEVPDDAPDDGVAAAVAEAEYYGDELGYTDLDPELDLDANSTVTACFLGPNPPFVQRTRTDGACNQNRAIDRAIEEARSAVRAACDAASYSALAADCNGTGWTDLDDQCAIIDFTPAVTVREADTGGCGIWPFRRRPWLATATRGGDCGWRCRSGSF